VVDEELEVIRAVFPDMVVRDRSYSLRRIKQVAIVSLKGRHGVKHLEDCGRLLTGPLEARGLGVIFCARKKRP
jgi:hypothetical protein